MYTTLVISLAIGLALALWLMKKGNWDIDEYGGVPALCGVAAFLLSWFVLCLIFNCL